MGASTSASAIERPKPSLGMVRVAGIMGYAALVAELGADPQRLIAGCGLQPRVLEEPDNIIPFSLAARLLHLAAQQTDCPHFGLLLGQRQDLSVLGPVGFLVRHSPDVRTAIMALIRHMHLHVQGANTTLSIEGKRAHFCYHIQARGLLGAEQVYRVCVANMFNFMRLLCGETWLPSAVHFSYPRPADDSAFVAFFRAPVLFAQSSNTLFFGAQQLDRPTVSADPVLRNVLQEHVTQVEANHSGDFCVQLRHVLKMLLPTGKCSVERVADLFSMHRRTLHRQLMSLGTSFESILDSVRREIAGEMIVKSDMAVSHLANTIGYLSPSAFNRAFHRWYGVSPREWRSRGQAMEQRRA